MALTRSARLHLIDSVLAAVDGRKTGTPESESRINMILVGFDLNEVTAWESSQDDFIVCVRRRLQEAEESTLLEVADHLRVPASRDGQPIDDSGIWTNGFIRVFLSHSAQHQAFVPHVADHPHQPGLPDSVPH